MSLAAIRVPSNPTAATEDAINNLRTEFKKIKESFVRAVDTWRAHEGDVFGFH
jgi:hypothetical protein